ncbi:unnamed protein product, partial [Urochloa humidicola]
SSPLHHLISPLSPTGSFSRCSPPQLRRRPLPPPPGLSPSPTLLPSPLLTAMLPRRQSIFHLGEEGGAAVHHHRAGVVGAAAMAGANGRRAARERERLVVGLQILVNHHHHSHGRHAQAANIVVKQMVRPRTAAAAASRHGGVSCSFLKACSLCRRDLSPSKDVYMYRCVDANLNHRLTGFS